MLPINVHHERRAIIVAGSHPCAETDNRSFFLWHGRTVLSSNASAGALAELHTGWKYVPDLAAAVSHDNPSRSVNSVFTPTNERRSSAHCACEGYASVSSGACDAYVCVACLLV